MMFMMPMPPTTREMPAMAPRRIVSVRLTFFAVAVRSFWVWTVKSSSKSWRLQQQGPESCLRLVDIAAVRDLDDDLLDIRACRRAAAEGHAGPKGGRAE